jgi:hypothetical protein
MNSHFCSLGQQQLEENCEAFQKHHLDQQCNENKPLKDIHKDIPVKLRLSHLLKYSTLMLHDIQKSFRFKILHKTRNNYAKP